MGAVKKSPGNVYNYSNEIIFMINVRPLLYITNSLRTGIMCVDADDVPLGSIFPRLSCKLTSHEIKICIKFFIFSPSPSAAIVLFGKFPSHDMLSCFCRHSMTLHRSHCHPHFHPRLSFRVFAFCTFVCLKVAN